MKKILFILSVCLFLAACTNNSNSNKASKKSAKEAGSAPTVSNKKSIEYHVFPKSTEFNDAQLETMDYKNGKFTFTYSGKDYKLGMQTPDAGQLMCANSGKGQHIHLIIDNEPYQASYTPEFEYKVADGDHYILAFLSRSYHESIKNGKAFIAKKVKIANGSIVSSSDIKDPMVFYSRPKGTYTGKKETDDILLDYYLINVKPESDLAVSVEVNKEAPKVFKKWSPHFIENLPIGDNTIKLTLINHKTGEAVKSPLNPVERTFTLQEDPFPTAQK